MEALQEVNRRRGVDPDGQDLAPRLHPDRYRDRGGGVPWELRARALEALDEARFGVKPERESEEAAE